jgi:predicted Holliday junction resolvase-like endonuclease
MELSISQNTLWIIVAVTALAFVYLLIKYIGLRWNIDRSVERRFEQWRDADRYREVEKAAHQESMAWRQQHEKRIREDAIKRSEAVIKGKATEHMMPYLPDFHYDPSDARFIGAPIDFIVFDGLSEGQLRSIVFVEVKTGHRPTLNQREKQVEEAVLAGRVEHDIMHVKDE